MEIKTMHTQTTFKEIKSYQHGSNEISYQNFICSCCGDQDSFGKIACLSCYREIRNAVNAHKDLLEACKSALACEIGSETKLKNAIEKAEGR